MSRQRFTVQLEAADAGMSDEVASRALRGFLKALLRRHGFRAVSAAPADPPRTPSLEPRGLPTIPGGGCPGPATPPSGEPTP